MNNPIIFHHNYCQLDKPQTLTVCSSQRRERKAIEFALIFEIRVTNSLHVYIFSTLGDGDMIKTPFIFEIFTSRFAGKVREQEPINGFHVNELNHCMTN